MALSVEKVNDLQLHISKCTNAESLCARTHVEKLLQVRWGQRHVLISAEFPSAESQDVLELPTDALQRLRVTHQVIHHPEDSRNRVPQRRPQDGEVMS